MELEKKIFFASDVHLGAPNITNAKEHEARFVSWLNYIMPYTRELYLMGDIFDFWFEYKHVIPQGYTRVLGKLCEFNDHGIPVHFFTGNHDIWVFDYLPRETGMKVYRKPLKTTIDGKRFFLAHGDGLTAYEKNYKRLKALFTSPLAQTLFKWLHPDLGISLAKFWSRKSRHRNQQLVTASFQGEENEWLFRFARQLNKEEHFNYYVFGHRHIALNKLIANDSRIIYLGDWITHYSYGEWDGENFHLRFYNSRG